MVLEVFAKILHDRRLLRVDSVHDVQLVGNILRFPHQGEFRTNVQILMVAPCHRLPLQEGLEVNARVLGLQLVKIIHVGFDAWILWTSTYHLTQGSGK